MVDSIFIAVDPIVHAAPIEAGTVTRNQAPRRR
jgi:hypothetical protein